ncbi:MAG: hypothetical protein HDR00_01790 [Lachnospiraceae bacterium]|nr:hypothetical protein [Lachnospiraceae bacterium]
MSIGVSGIIKLKKYSVSNAVELSYEISRLATIYKIGFKMGGNVSEEVYEIYKDELTSESIMFEFMDTPLDNYAGELFQPTIGKDTDYEKEFRKIMINNLNKIVELFRIMLDNEIIDVIDLDINYLFKELNDRKELSIGEMNDYILKEYQKSNYCVPTLSIRIKK